MKERQKNKFRSRLSNGMTSTHSHTHTHESFINPLRCRRRVGSYPRDTFQTISGVWWWPSFSFIFPQTAKKSPTHEIRKLISTTNLLLIVFRLFSTSFIYKFEPKVHIVLYFLLIFSPIKKYNQTRSRNWNIKKKIYASIWQQLRIQKRLEKRGNRNETPHSVTCFAPTAGK